MPLPMAIPTVLPSLTSPHSLSSSSSSFSLSLKEIFTKRPPKLPSKISWQIEYAVRTAYSTAICFLFVYYVQWGSLTIIAPVFSAMSTTMYFGVWQKTYWTVLISSCITVVVGAFVGLTWKQPILLILLIFWIILWIGKCTIWNPTAKTFGGVTFILCALSPLVSQGTLTTFQVIIGVFLTTNIPFLLTGVTLLFPYPRFAHTRCQESLELLSDRFSRILCDYVDSYCNSEESDLFLSIAQGHTLEAKNLLQLITELSTIIESESYLFPKLTRYGENLRQLIPLLKKILDELIAMGTILPDIIRNETHAMHIKVMKSTLRQTALQFRTVLMMLAVRHMNDLIPSNFLFLPIGTDWIPTKFSCSCTSLKSILLASYHSILAFLCSRRNEQDLEGLQNQRRGINTDLLEAINSLIAFEQVLLSSAQCARDDYVFIKPPTSVMIPQPVGDDSSSSLHPNPTDHIYSPLHNESSKSGQQLFPSEEKDSRQPMSGVNTLSPLQLYERTVYQAHPPIVGTHDKSSPPLPPSSSSSSTLDAPVSTFMPMTKPLRIDEHSADISVSVSVTEVEMTSNHLPLPSPPKRNRSISFSDHPPTVHSYSNQFDLHDCSSSDKTSTNDIESAIKESVVPSQDEDTDSIVSWRYTTHRHPSIYENTTIDKETGMQTNYATILYFENLRYGTHNWSPRLSFLATLLSVMDVVGDIKQLDTDTDQEPIMLNTSSRIHYFKSYLAVNYWRFQHNYPVISELLTSTLFVFHYLYDSILEPYKLSRMSITLLYFYLCSNRDTTIDPSSSQQINEYRHYLHHYIHPIKIAIITSICSLFVILPVFQELFPYGLWGVVVVTIIRQDNSSSSFSRGFQRIEGTVLGCIYAYLISLLFNCEENSCYTAPVVLLVVLWLGFCAYFREGVQRGYAAIVAGFTPIIVLLGSSNGSQAGAWSRVEMTVVGVSVYLIIDNILLPSRADVAMRKNIISSISHVTKLLTATSHSLDGLFCLADSNNISSSTEPETAAVSSSSASLATATVTAASPSLELPSLESISPGGEILVDFDADDAEISNYLSNHVAKNMKHLDLASIEFTHLTMLVAEQSTLLQLAALEPELWHRPFPHAAYQSLHRCMERVVLSSRSLYTAIVYLHRWAQEETSLREFRRHIEMIGKMNQYLIQIVFKAEKSLQAQEISLKRILNGIHSNEEEDMKTLSAMITLSRTVDDVLKKLNQESRQYYFQQTTTNTQRTNIEFAVYWLGMAVNMISVRQKDLSVGYHTVDVVYGRTLARRHTQMSFLKKFTNLMNRIRLKPTVKFSTFDIIIPLPDLSSSTMSTSASTNSSMQQITGVTRKFSAIDLNCSSPNSTNTPSTSSDKTAEIEQTPAPIPPPSSKKPFQRPNYFLGIRLTCPIFQQHLSSFQQNIISKSPHLTKCMTSVQKLHLTCFVFHLQSKDDLLLAQNCFLNCQDHITSMISSFQSTFLTSSSSLSLTFNSIQQFSTNVLFISPLHNEILQLLKEINYYLADEFQRHGLFPPTPQEMVRVNQWSPHVTIAKIKASSDRKRGGRGRGAGGGGGKKKLQIKKENYENCTDLFENDKTIDVKVERIDLLAMAEQSDEGDGYYKSYGTLYLR